jgi:hypothetical protein
LPRQSSLQRSEPDAATTGITGGGRRTCRHRAPVDACRHRPLETSDGPWRAGGGAVARLCQDGTECASPLAAASWPVPRIPVAPNPVPLRNPPHDGPRSAPPFNPLSLAGRWITSSGLLRRSAIGYRLSYTLRTIPALSPIGSSIVRTGPARWPASSPEVRSHPISPGIL